MSAGLEKTAYWLLKKGNRAIRDYEMITDGDRVAVAVSGGKDSLAILKLLDLRRNQTPEHYELVAIHIVGNATGPWPALHPPLAAWFEQEQTPYQAVALRLGEQEQLPMNCYRCTWKRRKLLFVTAKLLGCNVLVFGHHIDDLAQTRLLNILVHGTAKTMLPKRTYFNGQFRLIRPLCLVEESEIRRFSRLIGFPELPPVWSQAGQSRRRFIQGDLYRYGKPSLTPGPTWSERG